MLFNKLVKNENEVLEIVANALADEEHIILTYLNQYCFNIYNSHPEYRNLLDNKFTVFLDGFGVYAALKFLGYKDMQKFNATDLYDRIFQQFSINHTRLFFIGSNFTEKFISDKTKVKNLNLCGYQHGYYKDEELKKIVETINNARPEAIIIGMGAPKQEILAAIISDSIQNKVILCVGGFLEFYFGTKKRAPDVMRNSGFEWFHRLIKEPGRLWKRFLIGIPVFLFIVIKEYFRLQK